MKRSPMKRGKPLARGSSTLGRTTRLRPKRATPRKSGRVRDEDYLARVRQLPCYVCRKPGPNEADHQGTRPFGRKADDVTCVSMCGGPLGCHQMRTDGYLPSLAGVTVSVKRWWCRADKRAMREWCDRAIAATQAELGLVKEEG